THFVPDLIDAAEAGSPSPEGLLTTITSQREWGDFGLTEKQLMDAFAEIEPDETPDQRIRRFSALTRSHPDHPETRMLLTDRRLGASRVTRSRFSRSSRSVVRLRASASAR
ncbi:hypothetical protein LCGC14_1756970, partial [marine sediment metagenome]